jgi:hypothetical protein
MAERSLLTIGEGGSPDKSNEELEKDKYPPYAGTLEQTESYSGKYSGTLSVGNPSIKKMSEEMKSWLDAMKGMPGRRQTMLSNNDMGDIKSLTNKINILPEYSWM